MFHTPGAAHFQRPATGKRQPFPGFFHSCFCRWLAADVREAAAPLGVLVHGHAHLVERAEGPEGLVHLRVRGAVPDGRTAGKVVSDTAWTPSACEIASGSSRSIACRSRKGRSGCITVIARYTLLTALDTLPSSILSQLRASRGLAVRHVRDVEPPRELGGGLLHRARRRRVPVHGRGVRALCRGLRLRLGPEEARRAGFKRYM